MLKNRPPSNKYSSPNKVTTHIKAQYKRIGDRICDDPVLCKLSIPLPNINAKSISMFITKEKKANLKATVIPKVKRHQKVILDKQLPEAPNLPQHLTAPGRPQVQYPVVPHVAGKRR